MLACLRSARGFPIFWKSSELIWGALGTLGGFPRASSGTGGEPLGTTPPLPPCRALLLKRTVLLLPEGRCSRSKRYKIRPSELSKASDMPPWVMDCFVVSEAKGRTLGVGVVSFEPLMRLMRTRIRIEWPRSPMKKIISTVPGMYQVPEGCFVSWMRLSPLWPWKMRLETEGRWLIHAFGPRFCVVAAGETEGCAA